MSSVWALTAATSFLCPTWTPYLMMNMEKETDTGDAGVLLFNCIYGLYCTSSSTNQCFLFLILATALRHRRRVPSRLVPAAQPSLSVKGRPWRTLHCWMRCVWTVVIWQRTAFCDNYQQKEWKSVKTKTWGAAKVLGTSIDSALSQTSPPSESSLQRTVQIHRKTIWMSLRWRTCPLLLSGHCPLLGWRGDALTKLWHQEIKSKTALGLRVGHGFFAKQTKCFLLSCGTRLYWIFNSK